MYFVDPLPNCLYTALYFVYLDTATDFAKLWKNGFDTVTD